MFNASGEAKKIHELLVRITALDHKPQEELDYDEAMAELDKEFPTYIIENERPW